MLCTFMQEKYTKAVASFNSEIYRFLLLSRRTTNLCSMPFPVIVNIYTPSLVTPMVFITAEKHLTVVTEEKIIGVPQILT